MLIIGLVVYELWIIIGDTTLSAVSDHLNMTNLSMVQRILITFFYFDLRV